MGSTRFSISRRGRKKHRINHINGQSPDFGKKDPGILLMILFLSTDTIENVRDDKMNKYKKRELIVDALASIPIFDGLNAQEINFISGYMDVIEFVPGQIIFREGDKGDFVCFVVDGLVDVFKKSESGEEILLSSASRGRPVGEMAVLDKSVRSASVKAQTNATLITLSKENFDSVLEENCQAGSKILKGISRFLSLNMRQTSSKLADHLPA